MSFPKVAIIVLNWNGGKDTLECLESLSQINYPHYQIIVVDNGSTDGSVEKIKAWKERKGISLEILSLEENVGFARGNNIGIKYALKQEDVKYILVLNNDTVVNSNFLSPLINTFHDFPNVGLTGPKIIDYYRRIHWQGPSPHRINFLTNIMFFTPLNRFFIRTPILQRYLLKGDKPQKVYGIPGCCMLFKREVFEKIGFFDERTYLGWEEYIIAEKLLKNNLNVYAVPESIIYHKVAQDTSRIDAIEKTIIFLESEKYFQYQYLKMPYFQQLLVKLVRTLIYFFVAIMNNSYRQNLKRLIKAIYG